MERARNNDHAPEQGMINNGLFGPDAVETAAFVEPIKQTHRQVVVVQDTEFTARRGTGRGSGSRYLTPFAAFGAAAAMAFGMFVGGNLLLNYGDQISALFNGTEERPLVAERAFAGAVAALHTSRPRAVQKSKTAEAQPVDQPAEMEVISQDVSLDLPAELNDAPPTEPREEVRNDRGARFRNLERIRDRQQKNLKEFLESSDDVADN